MKLVNRECCPNNSTAVTAAVVGVIGAAAWCCVCCWCLCGWCICDGGSSFCGGVEWCRSCIQIQFRSVMQILLMLCKEM